MVEGEELVSNLLHVGRCWKVTSAQSPEPLCQGPACGPRRILPIKTSQKEPPVPLDPFAQALAGSELSQTGRPREVLPAQHLWALRAAVRATEGRSGGRPIAVELTRCNQSLRSGSLSAAIRARVRPAKCYRPAGRERDATSACMTVGLAMLAFAAARAALRDAAELAVKTWPIPIARASFS